MADHVLKDDEKADELVEMIEQLMSGGSGHLTISEDDLVSGGMSVLPSMVKPLTSL